MQECNREVDRRKYFRFRSIEVPLVCPWSLLLVAYLVDIIPTASESYVYRVLVLEVKSIP